MSIANLNSEKKKMLIPQLRFNGFEGEWKLNSIGNTCIVKTGGSDTQDRIDDGIYPFFVRSNTVERINTFSFDGEAILTSGDGVGVGKNFHYINGKFDYHQRVYALREFKKDYSGKFIYQVFKEQFYKRVIKLSAKNSVDSVRMSMITEMKISFPTLPEQQKIASFLSAVDEKIQQLSHKKELLEQYKKGVMQQLFSGKLRFKDENGKDYPDWEEKKLGEVCEIVGGGTPDTNIPEYWGGEIQWFTPTEIKSDFVSNSIRTITELGLQKSSAKKLPIGTILLTTRATIGEVSIAGRECTTNQGFQSLITSKENCSIFIFNWIKRNKHELISRANGSTFPEISKNAIEKISLNAPSLPEQQKIANFLSSIDTKIENVNGEIVKTQLFKKGLLQQMFV